MREQVAESLLTCEGAPEAVSARLCFPPELPVFAGHFPGRPLVPGVFLIEAARLVGERTLGRSVRIAQVRRAKFSLEVQPGADVAVEATLSESGGLWTCTAKLGTSEGSAARVELALEEVK